jgi:tetratricopeptide (TPR) repeat protein
MIKKNIPPSPGKGPAKTTVAAKPAFTREESPQMKIFLIAGILIITFLAYFPSLHNELLKTWDDQAYVTNNDLIKSLSFDNIKRIFREDRGLYANYHPLTTLSLALNFRFSKLDSTGYHFTNLILHLLNTLLVFIFIYKLSGRRLETATVVSLLFGLNPMHVESVSWISERKDVLYTFFFLLSVIAYQNYLKRNDLKLYFFSILLFLCSLLSKAMAASLPLVLLLIDYFLKRKWNARIFLEKLPYFALSVILGIFAIHIQAEGHATSSQMFPINYRFMHACYGFLIYILKTFIPTGLSAFYPYPYPLVNSGWVINSTPVIFYITVILIIALLVFLIFNIIRPHKYSDPLVFGILFYACTITLVLQFLPVGRAIMADRYSYIPSIGLFFILGAFFSHLYRNKKFKIPALTAIIVYSGIMCYLTFERNKVWKNDETLWNDVIHQYPDDSRITLAIYNRGNYYYEKEKFNEALKDYQTVAEYNPGDDNVLEKIGKIYGQKLNDLDHALLFFQKAYKINPANLEVLQDLGTIYGMKGDPRRSLEYSLKGLELKADDALLLLNAGISYKNIGENEKGDNYIARAHKIDPALKP